MRSNAILFLSWFIHLAASLSCLMLVQPDRAVAEESYSLVLAGGRVIDPETNLDAIRNVGVNDGKIAAVTEKAIEGKETIDASGHVVAPGFIDMHFHNVGTPFGVKLALRDGVTTPLELEVGVYPVKDWYASQEGKSQSNYGASVTSMGIREILHNPSFNDIFCGQFLQDVMVDPKDSKTSMKWSTVKSTPEQIQKFGEMLDEGLITQEESDAKRKQILDSM